MRKTMVAIALVVCLAPISELAVARDRALKGALIGGTVGAVAGNGMNDALKGAAIGGGIGAVTEDGRRGRNARDGAVKGAVIGAAVGGVAGNGMDDALKGAAWGAAGGAIIGGSSGRNRDWDDDRRYDSRHHGRRH